MTTQYGIQFDDIDKSDRRETFVPPNTGENDGAILTDDVFGTGAAALEGVLDVSRIPKDQTKLIETYRNLGVESKVDDGIIEIVNESIVTDSQDDIVEIQIDSEEISEKIKNIVRDEFDEVLKLLKFDDTGADLFRHWYVDGRIAFHKVVDPKRTKKGILDVVRIDPRHLRKFIRSIDKDGKVINVTNFSHIELYNLNNYENYYVYSRGGFSTNTASNQTTGLEISDESISFIPSGMVDCDGNIIGYLHKVIKAHNVLSMMEDSLVVLRVTRATERRVFYIDVGSLPTAKAEQYMKDVMTKYRTKTVYDSKTGTIQNKKNQLSMTEDYWLPRREGGRGTEIDTLPGASNLGEITDLEYLKTEFYKTLNVPPSRFSAEGSVFNVGRSSEITRDEIKFQKFISRLRRQFSRLFKDLLKTQLILKKVMTPDEWEAVSNDIRFQFTTDNLYKQFKESEIMQNKIGLLTEVDPFIGKFFSFESVQKNILGMTDQDIADERKRIEDDRNDPFYTKIRDEENEDGGQ